MLRAAAPPREMTILGLVELTLSFTALYIAIQAAGAPMPLPSGTIALAAVLAVIIGGVALTIGLYRPEVCLDRKRLLAAGSLGTAITLTVLLFIEARPNSAVRLDSTLHIAEAIAAWLAAMAFIRLAYGFVIGHGPMTRRVLLFGDPARVRALTIDLRSRRGHLFDPIVYQDQPVSWPSLRQWNIWGVVVASEPDGATADALLDCKFRGMRIASAAAFREKYLGRIDLDALTANNLMLGQDVAAGRVSAVLKRLCDIVIGGGLLLLLLPLMTMTALAIKLDSPGPVFDRQRRTGRFDTTFNVFKFRSMTVEPKASGTSTGAKASGTTTGAEAGGLPRWAGNQDPRVTRVGRIIRAARIDELPQLANLLRGDMALVGPSTELPLFTEQLARAIPFYRQRTYVKPGLTGWAQVNVTDGAPVTNAREKLAFDLYYVKNHTIALDIIILAATIRGVLFRRRRVRS
jgi:lipopolysaccharide/colanic/teichoic acid biosynthesis glycosyltransferase